MRLGLSLLVRVEKGLGQEIANIARNNPSPAMFLNLTAVALMAAEDFLIRSTFLSPMILGFTPVGGSADAAR